MERKSYWEGLNQRARDLLISHTHWAELAGVSLATISRLNNVDGALDRAFPSTLRALEEALDEAEKELHDSRNSARKRQGNTEDAD